MSFINKIVLGTAQLGMNYGIANFTGKPTKKEIFNILSYAWEKGIRRFDTAPGYGSERILGEFIATNGLQKEAKLLTKIPSLHKDVDYKKTIQTSIKSSLKKLNCHIDTLFLHNQSDSDILLNDPLCFLNIPINHPVVNIGVSVYNSKEIKKLSTCAIDLALQFPYNILDRRCENIKMAIGKRYARSIFLQGVLASKNSLKQNAPKELHDLHNKYHALLSINSIDPVEYAISFVANSDAIDYFLVGVDNEAQIRDILKLACNNSPEFDILSEINQDIDVRWLDPRKWN